MTSEEAINAIRKGGIMHERYQRYITRGMIKMKALVAIMRKLLNIMFVLAKNHSEFKINPVVYVAQAA